MYPVLPDRNKEEKAPEKTPGSKIKDIFMGNSSRPFGFFDFLIVWTASSWYFFFTGFAILLGRNIPPKWLSIAFKLNEGKVVKGIAEKAVQPKVTKIVRPTTII